MKKLMCMMVVLNILGVGIIMPSQADAQMQMFEMENSLVGKPAPDFTLETLNGGTQNLTKFRNGQPTIVFFWATWCPHCRTALNKLVEKKAEFEKKGVKIALVDAGESESTVRSYVEKNKVDYEMFLDKQDSLAEPYGIIGVPTFFFLNKDGVVQAVEHSLPSNYEALLKAEK